MFHVHVIYKKQLRNYQKYRIKRLQLFNSENKAITINSDKSCGGCSVCFHRCPNNAILLNPIKNSK
ncbi:MAG: ferredoxin [Promethearchaeota archaeon]